MNTAGVHKLSGDLIISFMSPAECQPRKQPGERKRRGTSAEPGCTVVRYHVKRPCWHWACQSLAKAAKPESTGGSQHLGRVPLLGSRAPGLHWEESPVQWRKTVESTPHAPVPSRRTCSLDISPLLSETRSLGIPPNCDPWGFLL